MLHQSSRETKDTVIASSPRGSGILGQLGKFGGNKVGVEGLGALDVTRPSRWWLVMDGVFQRVGL